MNPFPHIDELLDLPTLAEGQADDLKLDVAGWHVGQAEYDDVRYWTARCSIGDGEPFARTVHVEASVDGCWVDILSYDGDNPDDPESRIYKEEA